VSSTCLGHPNVHPWEELYMQFYGISCMHPYQQSGQCQDMTSWHWPKCWYGCKKYHKTAYTSLPEDEHMVIW